MSINNGSRIVTGSQYRRNGGSQLVPSARSKWANPRMRRSFMKVLPPAQTLEGEVPLGVEMKLPVYTSMVMTDPRKRRLRFLDAVVNQLEEVNLWDDGQIPNNARGRSLLKVLRKIGVPNEVLCVASSSTLKLIEEVWKLQEQWLIRLELPRSRYGEVDPFKKYKRKITIIDSESAQPIAGSFKHGTLNGYVNRGCRCTPCTSANATYQSNYQARAKAKEAKEAKEAREKLARLQQLASTLHPVDLQRLGLA